MPHRPLFFDTMCLAHFARADRLDVLRDLLVGRDSWTTTVVRSELREGATHHPQIEQALVLDGMQIARLDSLEELSCFVKWTSRLGAQDRDLGEASVFAAAELQTGIAITDDREATKVARRHGADVHGTIWLLAMACREGKLTPVAAGNVVDALRREGAYLPCTGDEFVPFAIRYGLLLPARPEAAPGWG
jgi:predicted nucleic acid-binding protein